MVRSRRAMLRHSEANCARPKQDLLSFTWFSCLLSCPPPLRDAEQRRRAADSIIRGLILSLPLGKSRSLGKGEINYVQVCFFVLGMRMYWHSWALYVLCCFGLPNFFSMKFSS